MKDNKIYQEKINTKSKIAFYSKFIFGFISVCITTISLFVLQKNNQTVYEALNKISTPTAVVTLSNSEVKLLFYDSVKAFDKREHEKAINTLVPLLDDYPNIFNNSKIYSYAYLVAGLSYLESSPKKDFSLSEMYLKMYLKQKAHTRYSKFATENLARALIEQQKTEEAKYLLKVYINDGSATSAMYTILGNIDFENDEFQAAISNYSKATSINGNAYYAYLGLASSYYSIKDCEKAKEYLRKSKESFVFSKKSDADYLKKYTRNKTLFKECK